MQFEDNDLVFAVKVLSLLERIFSTLIHCLPLFWKAVAQNLTSGVMGLPTVIETVLSCNDGFGPLLCLCFEEVLFLCTSRCYLRIGP